MNVQHNAARRKIVLRRTLSITLGAIALASPLLAFASAQDAGSVAANVTSNFSDLAKLGTGGAYLAGIFGVVFGVHKFWQKSHDNNGQVKFAHYAIPAVAGGALIAVAASAGVPVATLFGAGVNSTTAGVSGTTTY